MILHIDTNDLDQLGLDIRELWVLTALRILCRHKPWKGTFEELATKIQCGGKSSAQRVVKVLVEKGLVIETADGFSVSSQIETKPSQNGTDSSQNGTDPSQNGTESKEKEKNQKKIEKEDVNKNIKCVSNEGHTPTWEEVKEYSLQRNIPISIAEVFYCNYEATGWILSNGIKIQNWRAALSKWNKKEQQQQQRTSYSPVSVRSGRPHPQETIISEEACRRRDLDWQRHLQEQAQHDALVAQEESDPQSLAEREAILQRLCRRLGTAPAGQ